MNSLLSDHLECPFSGLRGHRHIDSITQNAQWMFGGLEEDGVRCFQNLRNCILQLSLDVCFVSAKRYQQQSKNLVCFSGLVWSLKILPWIRVFFRILKKILYLLEF